MVDFFTSFLIFQLAVKACLFGPWNIIVDTRLKCRVKIRFLEGNKIENTAGCDLSAPFHIFFLVFGKAYFKSLWCGRAEADPGCQMFPV